jgi:hypothetical protein
LVLGNLKKTIAGAIKKGKKGMNDFLFHHLKLARLEYNSIFIAKLVDVNTSVEIFKVDVDS